ncbi:hypothetical protein LPJ64_001842 [Coemansia asiatica]|uniref:Chitin synthase n=1 Tax=Coemansia asiatica TaxID=1052880 RepID=A0A9W8CLN4_9FUNG|nr:hypothetical protein LPJ64_001842 [Coemansia asiatica]
MASDQTPAASDNSASNPDDGPPTALDASNSLDGNDVRGDQPAGQGTGATSQPSATDNQTANTASRPRSGRAHLSSGRRITTAPPSALRQRVRDAPSLFISTTPHLQQREGTFDSTMPLGTPHTAMSHEISPLTLLEERVFQRSQTNAPMDYNVFNDDEVLKICDDDEQQDQQQMPKEQHGWRIDSVIDKYGNRIASRSKRLARIVAQRRRRSSEGAGTQLLPKGSSINGSSSTGAVSAGPSPIIASSAAVVSENEDGSSGGRSRTKEHRKRKAAPSPHMFLPIPDNADSERGAHNDNALASVESDSFGLANYSASGSTSAILRQQQKQQQQQQQYNNQANHKRARFWHKASHTNSTSGLDSVSGSVSGSGSGSGFSLPTPRIAWHNRRRQKKQQRRQMEALTHAQMPMQTQTQTQTHVHSQHRRSQRDWWRSLLPKTSAAKAAARRKNGKNSADASALGTGAEMAAMHRDRYQIYEFPKANDEPKCQGEPETEPKKKGFVSRIWGAVYAFALPGGYNRFGTSEGGAYTEYVGFLLAFVLASVAFIMWGVLAPKAICSTDQTFTLENTSSRNFVAANGIVSDFTLSRTSFGRMMHGYSGYDISSVFPLLGQLSPAIRETLPSPTAALLSKCISENEAKTFIERWRSGSKLYSGDADFFPEQCPFPQSPQTSGAECLTANWPQFLGSKVGILKINASEVLERHASAATSWVILDDKVYDVSMYATYASDEIVHNGTVDSSRNLRSDTMFLPESISKLFVNSPGKDISTEFHALELKDEALYKQCMDMLFLRGTTLTTKSPFACANTNIVAWVTFGLSFLVLFVRFAVAELCAQIRTRKVVLAATGDQSHGGADDASLEEAPNKSCVVVVPCFKEPLETLTRTFQGIARSTHPDSQTLLWIINDGNPAVLESILRILSHSGRASDPKFYGAYGGGDVGGGGFGAARVYAGFYECGRHRIAYVIAAKEAYQGRVDSLMMVLNLFRNLRAESKQSPAGGTATDAAAASASASPSAASKTIFLEEELEAQMITLGHPPAAIAHCLMLDGAIMIDPLAITQFVARMNRKPSIVALSGALYPVGRPSTLPQLLHFFEFYLRHFVSPICESLSNVTCPIDQLFTMYRVRMDDGSPCLGDDALVSSIDSLMKTSVRCRHRTWPANDCLLVPRLMRRFPESRWAFESNGRGEVEVTQERMVAFDPYERQWFRTRLVTLLDIQRGRMLKRTWPIMIVHLLFPFMIPAAACMLYLEIVISIFGDSPAIVVSELTGAFLAATFILFLLSRKWALAIYFLVYSALAVPFYHVWIPATAFFSMNRVWYPPERLEAQKAAAEANVQPPANFEAIKNNYLRRLSSTKEKNLNFDLSSDSEPEQESFVEHPSDSSRSHHGRERRQQNRQQITISGLGLTLGDGDNESAPPLTPISLNLQNVVVNETLSVHAHAVLQKILMEYPSGRVEPESADFYLVCERTLAALIPAHPSSSVAELAIAVNRSIDEILAMPSSPALPKHPSPLPPAPKFSRQGSGSGYLGSGRPVSVIMEEESDNDH